MMSAMSVARVLTPIAALCVVAAVAGRVHAGEAARASVKVGFVTTLSGPGAAIGADLRDGFGLALKSLGGRLGGVPAQLIVVDDEQTPELAQRATARLIRKEKVDFMTGIVFSNVLLAVGQPVFKSKTFYVSASAAPSLYAGEQCNAYFFSVAAQNDAPHEAMGKYIGGKGIRSVVVVTTDDADGSDAIAGFRRFYKGEISEEISTRAQQNAYSGELAQIRARKPAAVYLALPGEAASRFVRQFVAAGLSGETQLYAAGTSADEDVIAAVGAPMLGVFNVADWAHDGENAANKRFVAEFQQAYGRLPTLYAAQSYDAALLIDSAVRDVGGRLADKESLRRALEARRFKSVRGDFAFGANHYPVQNYVLRVVGRDAHDRVTNKTMGTVLSKHADAYVPQCAMK
jgi:branched-chain amino acid transport system substrate-binding protein